MHESTEALFTDDLNADSRLLRKYLSPGSALHNAGVWSLLTEVLDHLADQGYLSDSLMRMNDGSEGVRESSDPMGKIIGVIREYGTYMYREPRDHDPHAPDEMCSTMPCPEAAPGQSFDLSAIRFDDAPEAVARIGFSPAFQAELNERIDEWGDRLAARMREALGMATDEGGS